MRDDHDFDKMEGKKNPNVKHVKQPTAIRLDKQMVVYFKALAE